MESYEWLAKEFGFSITIARLTFQPYLGSLQHVHSKLGSPMAIYGSADIECQPARCPSALSIPPP